MRLPPIEVLESWPRPNYIDPETRGPSGKILGSVLLGLVTVILAVRLYSRKRLTNGFGLDDLFICLAYVPATAFTLAGIITQGPLQWSRHVWDVEPKVFGPSLILMLVNLILFDLATSFTKLSMLAMVRRLTTASSNRIEGAAVLVLAVLIITNCVIFIIVEVFQCWPIQSAFEITMPGSSTRCINQEVHLMFANITNTVTDFVVVLLCVILGTVFFLFWQLPEHDISFGTRHPIRTAMSLDIPTRHRVIVISLFGIGLIASSVGIARTIFTWRLFTAADYDTTWRSWYLWLASLIELHLGIICASVPATRPFFANYLGTKLGLTNRTNRTNRTRKESLMLSEVRSS